MCLGNLEQEEEVLAFLTNEDSLTIPDKIEEVQQPFFLLIVQKSYIVSLKTN